MNHFCQIQINMNHTILNSQWSLQKKENTLIKAFYKSLSKQPKYNSLVLTKLNSGGFAQPVMPKKKCSVTAKFFFKKKKKSHTESLSSAQKFRVRKMS